MLRFQQYIELVRTQNEQKLHEAIAHARKYLLPSRETYPKEVQQVAGLLAFPPGGRPSGYEVLPITSKLILFRIESNISSGSIQSVPLGRYRQVIHAYA